MNNKAIYHLPGLFEFYELYRKLLRLYREHREYFYEWCDIGSIYGAPADCLWGGGRVGYGDDNAGDVIELMCEYGISARLTFSNSLLEKKHLDDKKCNRLCEAFNQRKGIQNGIIVHSDLLLEYLKEKYENFYFVSSTTKVITDIDEFKTELDKADFSYVVPDFRFNHSYSLLDGLTNAQKRKTEFLCNECCFIGCKERKSCYENVSRKSLGEICPDHICTAPDSEDGYKFSRAMKNPSFIGIDDIKNYYLPHGFTNFKIEGRSLGSAVILEFLLYYLTKPEFQLNIREAIYLDSTLDLF